MMTAERVDRQKEQKERAQAAKIEQAIARNHRITLKRCRRENEAIRIGILNDEKQMVNKARKEQADSEHKRKGATQAMREQQQHDRHVQHLANERKRGENECKAKITALRRVKSKREAEVWQRRGEVTVKSPSKFQRAISHPVRKPDKMNIPQASQKPKERRQLLVGDLVRMQGLQMAQAEYNGSLGILHYWVEAHSRWWVNLELGGSIRVKPSGVIFVANGATAGTWRQKSAERSKKAKRQWATVKTAAKVISAIKAFEKAVPPRSPVHGETMLYAGTGGQVFKKLPKSREEEIKKKEEKDMVEAMKKAALRNSAKATSAPLGRSGRGGAAWSGWV
jgi:hypothetical protein